MQHQHDFEDEVKLERGRVHNLQTISSWIGGTDDNLSEATQVPFDLNSSYTNSSSRRATRYADPNAHLRANEMEVVGEKIDHTFSSVLGIGGSSLASMSETSSSLRPNSAVYHRQAPSNVPVHNSERITLSQAQALKKIKETNLQKVALTNQLTKPRKAINYFMMQKEDEHS